MHNAGARDGGFDERAVGGSFHLFHGVDGGPSGDGGSMLVRGLDHVANDFGGHEGANGIVHQDDIFGIGRGTGEGAGDGVLAMLAAFDHCRRLVRISGYCFSTWVRKPAISSWRRATMIS
jgi:hypothetical protein